MFSIHQIYSSAIMSALKSNEDFTAKDSLPELFNRSCMELTDYMVFLNVGLARIAYIKPRIDALSSQLETFFKHAIKSDLEINAADGYGSIISTLYSQLTNNEVVWPITCCVVQHSAKVAYKAIYSRSRFSAMSQSSVIEATRNGRIESSLWLGDLYGEPQKISTFVEDMINNLDSYLADPAINPNEQIIQLPVIFPDIDRATKAQKITPSVLSYVNAYEQGRVTYNSIVFGLREKQNNATIAGVKPDINEIMEQAPSFTSLINIVSDMFNYLIDDYNQHIFIEKKR